MDDKPIEHLWDSELTPQEISLIGQIVIHWGSLEHEIFTQTLMTFDTPEGAQTPLPKALNNLQVTELLTLWKERVVDKAQGDRSRVLQLQLDEILRLKDFRDALVHGMWHWSPKDLARVSTVRVRKKEVITVHFTADDLADFYRRLAIVNFKLRYPGGTEDLAAERAQAGSFISRDMLKLMSGDSSVGNELLKPFAKPDAPS